MSYFIGIDAGGTKTELMIADAQLHVLFAYTDRGCRLLNDGREALHALLLEGIDRLCAGASIARSEILSACLGISGYGESQSGDRMAQSVLDELFGPGKAICTNDCRIAWAASLGMKAGVNVIAGTGSIAYGEDGHGHGARSGGWSSIYDEGSCHWIGQELIGIYTKQADARLPRTCIYDAFRLHEGITDDESFIDTLNHGYMDDACHIASLQRICLDAWKNGDPYAMQIYRRAAHELALALGAAARKLNLPTGWNASYSGGLFHAGEAILHPLREELTALGANLRAPLAGPTHGALMIAREHAARLYP